MNISEFCCMFSLQFSTICVQLHSSHLYMSLHVWYVHIEGMTKELESKMCNFSSFWVFLSSVVYMFLLQFSTISVQFSSHCLMSLWFPPSHGDSVVSTLLWCPPSHGDSVVSTLPWCPPSHGYSVVSTLSWLLHCVHPSVVSLPWFPPSHGFHSPVVTLWCPPSCGFHPLVVTPWCPSWILA